MRDFEHEATWKIASSSDADVQFIYYEKSYLRLSLSLYFCTSVISDFLFNFIFFCNLCLFVYKNCLLDFLGKGWQMLIYDR